MTRTTRLDAIRPGRSKKLRLLCILAHPDDESLGLGGTLASYGAEGIETYLVTATRGERGWFGAPEENPGPAALGRIREQELRNAANVLGVRETVLLDYHDGEVDKADPSELQHRLVEEIRRIRPDVVVTFDENGVYGHPDHIAVTHATTAAVVAAADATCQIDTGDAPHRVSKLYHYAWTQEIREAYERAFGELVMQVDGVERRAVTWPQWTLSTWIDTAAHWERVWEAIRCHRSQLPGYQKLLDLPDEYHQTLWGQQTFRRVYALVPASAREDDLFDGLRDRHRAVADDAPVGGQIARGDRLETGVHYEGGQRGSFSDRRRNRPSTPRVA